MSGRADLPPPGLPLGGGGERPAKRRFSPRAIAENLATGLIACGVIMLMQPFSLTLYGWSFAVTLAGTLLFIVGSKFPD